MASRLVAMLAGSALAVASVVVSGCSDSATEPTSDSATASPAKSVANTTETAAPDTSKESVLPLLPEPSNSKPDEFNEPFAKLNLPRPNLGESGERPAFDPADAVHRGPWINDFNKALAQAKAEKKDILMDFTGSDWCTWCIRLNREVFTQTEFIKYAPEKFVLLELDFPRGESKLSPAIRKQNDQLQAKFEVQGFPSIVLADSQGRAYAVTGYEQGGPTAYISHLEQLRKVRETRDEVFAKADAASGVERAKLLNDALEVLPPNMVFASYRPVVEEIIKLDAKDEGGLKTQWQDKLSASIFATKWQQLGRSFGQSQDPDEILAGIAEAEKEFSHYAPGVRKLNLLKLHVYRAFNKLNDFNKGIAVALANKENTDEERFQLYMLKMTPLAEAQKFTEAEQVIQEALKVLSETKEKDVIINLHIVHARLLKDLKKIDLAKAAIKRAKAVAPEDVQSQIDEIANDLFDEDAPAIRPGARKPTGDQ